MGSFESLRLETGGKVRVMTNAHKRARDCRPVGLQSGESWGFPSRWVRRAQSGLEPWVSVTLSKSTVRLLSDSMGTAEFCCKFSLSWPVLEHEYHFSPTCLERRVLGKDTKVTSPVGWVSWRWGLALLSGAGWASPAGLATQTEWVRSPWGWFIVN